MSVVLTSYSIEFVLRRLSEHQPITGLGVIVQKKVRNMFQVEEDIQVHFTGHIDTAEEFKEWLSVNGALLEDPK